MATLTERTEPLNSLLRGELSALETYDQALTKMAQEPAGQELERLRTQHEEAAAALRQHLMERGVRPTSKSGIWGMWAKAVEGTAKIFGGSAALRALKEGERQGIRDYEKA